MSPVSPRPGALLILRRAFRRRCPNCGAGGIFSSWFKMVPRCPQCGLLLERGEQGYQVGSYMFNIAAAELVFLAVFLGVVAASAGWDDGREQQHQGPDPGAAEVTTMYQTPRSSMNPGGRLLRRVHWKSPRESTALANAT